MLFASSGQMLARWMQVCIHADVCCLHQVTCRNVDADIIQFLLSYNTHPAHIYVQPACVQLLKQHMCNMYMYMYAAAMHL